MKKKILFLVLLIVIQPILFAQKRFSQDERMRCWFGSDINLSWKFKVEKSGTYQISEL